ncbi:uncharacterized protein YndB with AHSA1/START domain [Friedmanniella endophytica]|uniref:Uncharacterized protein YndB with AHSA1/START domain n=1 Tax=Microlunatus kandeliicorticis TaxID=1759536 RepID=A0A7W3INY7_9ACTN|nr:SRPBCC domain-containing protein [Microlunatus kandeliicorticis]MBA8792542.1 uncharacterized protein YndB with AHSA1/START domain [Microlunatus kandeliicorticis]
MKLTASLHEGTDGRGSVRVDDVFTTDAADLWDACTRPERLARWIAEVEGDLRPDGTFRAVFTSGWAGTGRVEVCEPPRRLVLVTREDGEAEDHRLEATLVPDGDRCRLIIEEYDLPVDELPAYGAGWQVHLEDLAATLASGDRCDLGARWSALIEDYRREPVR